MGGMLLGGYELSDCWKFHLNFSGYKKPLRERSLSGYCYNIVFFSGAASAIMFAEGHQVLCQEAGGIPPMRSSRRPYFPGDRYGTGSLSSRRRYFPCTLQA